jgi:hypothetical protein
MKNGKPIPFSLKVFLDAEAVGCFSMFECVFSERPVASATSCTGGSKFFVLQKVSDKFRAENGGGDIVFNTGRFTRRNQISIRTHEQWF